MGDRATVQQGSGWIFAPMGDWDLSFFGLVHLPMLAKAIGPWHETLEPP